MDAQTHSQLKNYRYVVFRKPTLADDKNRALFDKSYAYWSQTWKKVMRHIDESVKLSADDYSKFDFVSVIFDQDTVVAQMTHRILDVNSDFALETPYFDDFKSSAKKHLIENNVSLVMSLEQNSINPHYSRRRSGFAFVEIMLYLNFRLAHLLGVKCCTALPRKITKVQDVLSLMGFDLIEPDHKHHDCPVDVMLGYIDKIKTSQDEVVRSAESYLWETLEPIGWDLNIKTENKRRNYELTTAENKL